jgi:hypothetical protein
MNIVRSIISDSQANQYLTSADINPVHALILVPIVSLFFFLFIFGFHGWLLAGGKACIRHFMLRLILFKQGYVPWNYARFLDYATKRLFMQKVGGGYIFIHRMLMEHFAQMPLKED